MGRDAFDVLIYYTVSGSANCRVDTVSFLDGCSLTENRMEELLYF